MTQQPGTRRQIIEQQRGAQAWKNIQEIKNLSLRDKDLEADYRSLARGLNAMIQINGLGQTLGFLKAKGKSAKGEPKAHFYLLAHLTHWMHEHFDKTNILDVVGSENDGLLHWVMSMADSANYRRATTECLAFGTWLRRFAEAELKDPNAPEVTNTQPQGGV